MRVALARKLGGIDSVELGELADPEPAAGQALVRVHGAGVGPWDVGFVGGGFPGIALPFVPGQEIAGVVEAAGEGAGVQSGDQVYAVLFPAGGGFAELALVSANRLAPMPASASFQEAAGLVISAATAHEALVDRGRLQAGETVLITAAAGGVGSAAVQIAVAQGARVLGAASVRDEGRAYFIVLQSAPPQLERGITGESFAAHGGRQRLEELARLVDAGKLRAQVEAVLPLDRAGEALARVAGRHTRGKIVLQIGE